jgi:RHS repeat-associated protein
MPHYTCAAGLRARVLCLSLAYLLLVSVAAPLLPRSVAATNDSHKPAPAPAAASPAAAPAQNSRRARAGEVIIRFREGVSDAEATEFLRGKGARRGRKLRGASRIERVELPAGQEPAAAVAELQQNPAVELVEPNYLLTKDAVQTGEVTPDDPRFAEQWALKNTGQSGGAVAADVHAPTAWQQTTGALRTVVAVIDGGIDFTHPDLQNNAWVNPRERAANNRDDDRDGFVDDLNGWDWITDSAAVHDGQGHGTAVAGIIAAEGNNGIGMTGVMWQASLMSLRVLDETGTGDVASAVEAIDYAVAHGAHVINCSWGMDEQSFILRDAIARAAQHDVVVVASAGNKGRDLDQQPYYPASFNLSNVVAVAASDNFDQLAAWSSFGAKTVAVAAPGADILTTQPGGSYTTVSGTSAATPLVAGIAGLVKTLRPALNAAEVRAVIMEGARRVAGLNGKVAAGGVADATGALAMLAGNGPNGGVGNGNGNGGNNGNGNGDANGNGQPYVPPALRPSNDNNRGNDKDGFNAAPPATGQGAPGANLPDLAASRKVRTSPVTDAPAGTIHADLICADCDPGGGGGAGGSDPYFGTSRTQPRNVVGEPGVTLGSRNFNWSLPIVELRGRAGLDLSLTLFYNSLVWTKQGSTIQYNADHGTPAPGFQFGLPRLQSQYFDTDEGAYSYLLITPSGGRVQLKQVGTSSVYESSDSTYTQLTFSGSTPIIRAKDGTQYIYGVAVAGEWRCTQIKDRNGNYISASYNTTNGHLLNVTDTLGRVINFNYDASGNLSTLTQTWGGTSHSWVTFIYTTVAMWPNFTGLSVLGPRNGASQTVLSYIAFADNTSYHFDYNAYGQVYQVRHKAPDGHELEHSLYTIDTSTAQTDCPRVTAKRDYAQNWNNGQEAVTTYAVTDNVTWTRPESGVQQTGTLAQQTAPDGTVYKEYTLMTGFAAGLPQLSEVWSGGVRKKWTSVTWTQDNTALSYAQNPRVAESNIYDEAGNRTRKTIEYTSYNLPLVTREWAGASGNQLLRVTGYGYRFDAEYVNRRIIGLIDNVHVYDGPTGALVSKVTYGYDWDWSGDMFQDVPGGVQITQHDRANYPATFIYGRGNLSQMARWDVSNLNNPAIETKWRVNITGSVLMVRDHLWHQTFFDYTDAFSDGVNRNTFAYPTKATDPDNNIATTQYNYDFGSVTRTHIPTGGTGAGTTYADEVLQYDPYGRLERVTNQTNGSYKRWVYENNANYIHTYQTVNDLTQANEFHAWQVLDGGGRVRAAASDHPGSVGGFAGQYFIYDQLGRVAQRSNPTEMNSAWTPTGDDATWVYTTQAYDWKGRPTQTTNPDGTTRIFTYGGCGCAGGEVVTAQDEHGRQNRRTMDALGRLAKVEELTWNGASVYATTLYTYNARDQITQINQANQFRTFEYDGYGRLWRRTTPEQGATTYTYNMDDTLNTVTDARGATTTYGYNYRHLVTSISYGVPAGVAATPNVTFSYNAAGNRTQMNDGQGSTAYTYDSLGRLTYEDRTFTGVGTYRLSYSYNLADQLTSITNPWGAQVSYAYDKAGRVAAVNGAGYAGITNYVNSLAYRAFGSIKRMNYSNGRTFTASYDNRLRPTSWNVSNVLGYNYSYNYFNEKTGRVTYAQGIYDGTLDRSYEYDHLGRLVISHAGTEARAHAFSGQWGIQDGPYSQGYDYDVWGNMTHRYGWGGDVQGGTPSASTDLWYTYTNNRRNGLGYDAAGNLTSAAGQTFSYDADGRQTYASATNLNQYYDGDGLRVKKTENGLLPTLYLRSSLLGGQVVAEIVWASVSWQWNRGYVYLGSQLISVQQNGVLFMHEDPFTKSKRVTNTSGTVVSAVEMDPWGADTNRNSNAAFQPRRFTTYERDANGEDEAMHRKYNRAYARFDQPDPYDGSYNLRDPQSFNRYSYVQNDPVSYTDPSGLLLMCFWTAFDGYYVETGQPVTILRFDGCIDFPDFGGFRTAPEPRGGGGPRRPQRPANQPQPKKCKQDKDGAKNAPEITDYLDRAGLTGQIDPNSISPSREGITFTFTNREAAVSALDANTHFRHRTPFNNQHLGQVNGNSRNVLDYRSFTDSKDGLGPKSLQVDVGPAGSAGANNPGALGYADLDCDNPAQDVVSAVKHGVPIFFRRVGRAIGGLFK